MKCDIQILYSIRTEPIGHLGESDWLDVVEGGVQKLHTHIPQ